jgi:hypothetical protein
MKISKHCQTRLSQRAIPSLIATLLLDHGSRMRHNGAEVLFIDKAARKDIRRAVGGDRNMRTVEPWLGTYLVVADDGTLVTMGHRTHRLRRP